MGFHSKKGIGGVLQNRERAVENIWTQERSSNCRIKEIT
jgi:hypothetical protein